MGESIVQECRGIILDESKDWSVVCRGFDKFFNLGEGHAADIDWATAHVQEKLDGSLCQFYFYDNSWHVSTSGTPDASGQVNRNGTTFHDYFFSIFNNLIGGNIPGLAQEYTFMLELCGPQNRVVVVHSEPSLHIIGGRHTPSGKEISASEAHRVLGGKIPHVKSFNLASPELIHDSFSSMSPLSQEGYVVVDSRFNRVKIKHPGYVALHHAKDGLGAKAFIEIARTGETSEVINAFPEFAGEIENYKKRVDSLINNIEKSYEEFSHIENQKDFALCVIKLPWSGALFQIRSGKVPSAKQFVRDMNIDKLQEILDK